MYHSIRNHSGGDGSINKTFVIQEKMQTGHEIIPHDTEGMYEHILLRQ